LREPLPALDLMADHELDTVVAITTNGTHGRCTSSGSASACAFRGDTGQLVDTRRPVEGERQFGAALELMG